MVSKRLTLSKVVLTLLIFLLLAGIAFAAPFTADLGEYKTMSAVTDVWHRLPQKAKLQAVICHSGETYKLYCGEAPDPKPLKPLLFSLKANGLTASVAHADISGCVPAQQFVETFGSEKIPPPPPAKSSKTEAPSPLPDRQPLATKLLPKKILTDNKPHRHNLGPGRIINKNIMAYADLNDPDVKQYENSTTMMVQPNISTKVLMSNRDINRVVCEVGPIKDVVFSKEKGISVKIDGNNAFVKFLINGDTLTGKKKYATVPSEFYVVCGSAGDVYTLVASPKNIPAQTIFLTSPRKNLDKNLSLFKGVPFEDTVVSLIKDTYTDKIPDSFTVKSVNRVINIFRNINVFWKQIVRVDGQGLELKEYDLTLKPSAPENEMSIQEKNFLLPALAQNPVGISLEHLTLKKNQVTRLFIVEKYNQESVR